MNIKPLILLGSALLPGLVHAESPAAPAVPSVQENMVAMDTNKDGMVTVSEVRAFIEAKHGKGYEKSLLDKMEASTSGLSCATPFANRFY
jgi:hypothetical protein